MGQSVSWYFSKLQGGIHGFIIHIPEGIAAMGFVPSPCPLTMIFTFYLFFNYDLLVTFPKIAELVHLLEVKRFPDKIKTGIQ